MIVECPNCYKKFNIDSSLIPIKGRLVQCSGCNHKWHFVPKSEEKTVKKENKNDSSFLFEEDVEDNKNVNKTKDIATKKINNQTQKKNVTKSKVRINYFKMIIVVIISVIAIVLVVDTFKNQLSTFIPGLKEIMNNLHETLLDIKLFIIDLSKND